MEEIRDITFEELLSKIVEKAVKKAFEERDKNDNIRHYTLQQAAELTNIHWSALRMRIKDGKLKAHQHSKGKKYIISHNDLMEYISKKK